MTIRGNLKTVPHEMVLYLETSALVCDRWRCGKFEYSFETAAKTMVTQCVIIYALK